MQLGEFVVYLAIVASAERMMLAILLYAVVRWINHHAFHWHYESLKCRLLTGFVLLLLLWSMSLASAWLCLVVFLPNRCLIFPGALVQTCTGACKRHRAGACSNLPMDGTSLCETCCCSCPGDCGRETCAPRCLTIRRASPDTMCQKCIAVRRGVNAKMGPQMFSHRVVQLLLCSAQRLGFTVLGKQDP